MLDESAANGARTAGEAIIAIYKALALNGKAEPRIPKNAATPINYYFENYPRASGYLIIEAECTYIQVGRVRVDLPHIVNDQLPKGRGDFMIRVESGEVTRGRRVLWKKSTSSK